MKVCIAGKNEIAIKAMSFLLRTRKKHDEIYACPNQDDDGVNKWQKSLVFFCKKKNIKIISLQDCYNIENLIFFSLQFDKIIDPNKFKSKKLFNIHFSLLPANKGMHTAIIPILRGEQETGVTLHLIDIGIDRGSIVEQKSFSIGQNLNSSTLYKKYLDYGFKLFKLNFNKIKNNNFNSTKQKSKNSSYYSKDEISFDTIKINLNKTAWEIHNQIRAFSFREFQLPSINNIKVYKSRILKQYSTKKAGTIEQENEVYFIFHTIDYLVKIYKDLEDLLFQSAVKGDLNTIKKITKQGFDITIRNSSGWNILIIACYNEHIGLIKWLIDEGFDINIKNYKGTTAIMYAHTAAINSERKDILTLLLKQKPKLNLTDDKGFDFYYYLNESNNKELSNHVLKNINNKVYP